MKEICSIRSALIASLLTLTACGSDTKDTQAPSITLNGESPMFVAHGSDFSDPGASANDNNDGSISLTVSGNVDTTIVGSYTLTYSATDAAGNSANSERIVNVTDQTAPTIALEGDSTIVIAHGSSYIDAGAAVTDNVDSDLTAVVTGSVDTSTIGNYTLTYSATDSTGNSATSIIRTIEVVENTGKIVGIVVSGMSYNTATQSGVTDVQGQYRYLAGESITFSIGDTPIGDTITAKAEISMLDLLPETTLYTTYSQIYNLGKLLENHPKNIAFFRFSNTLSLLESVDEDSNPDNGINILPELLDMFSGVEIDMQQHIYYLAGKGRRWGKGDKKLKRILQPAASMGLIDSGNIPNYGISLDNYYRLNNIEHQFSVKSITHTDSDANGTIDDIEIETYDAQGNIISITEDTDNDGNIDRSRTYTYNDNGQQLSRLDGNHDGSSLTSANYYTYDINGNQTIYQGDNNGDGNINSRSAYVYDAYGNRLSYTNDNDADGVIDSINTDTYDENSNNIYSSNDGDNDGAIDNSGEYTYDNQGNQLTSKGYSGDKGTLTSESIYTYDTMGNRLTSQNDWDADGNFDNNSFSTYDSNNNILTRESDYNGDNVIDFYSTYTYDVNGFDNTRTEIEVGISEENYTYTYDEKGNLLSYHYTDNNGTERSRIYTFDSNGNEIKKEVDEGSDGSIDSIYIYGYDSNNNYIYEHQDNDGDGTIDKITTFTVVPTSFRAVLYDAY